MDLFSSLLCKYSKYYNSMQFVLDIFTFLVGKCGTFVNEGDPYLWEYMWLFLIIQFYCRILKGKLCFC